MPPVAPSVSQVSDSLSFPSLSSAPSQATHVARRPQAEAPLEELFSRPTGLVLPIATASLSAHLLIVAWFGAGVPQAPVRPVRPIAAPITPVTIEQVQLQPEPPAPEPELMHEEAIAQPDAPTLATPIEVPALPEVQAIAAVPSTVPVAFGLAVNGPVRLVSDAASASGAVGGRRQAQPVALDLSSEQNLVLAPVAYPPRAKRQRLTGTVIVEFRTTPAGDISDVRVRSSSGHVLLDDAAAENLRHGRWKGRPGYYAKAYEFTLN